MPKNLPGTANRVQDWSPHMSFILKGSQIATLQLQGWFKSKTSIQEYRNKIQNSYWTCAWIIWYMFPVQCEELRIDHLTLLLVATFPYACWFLWWTNYIDEFKWRLPFPFGVAFWRAKSRLKGIKDFDLEHWLFGRFTFPAGCLAGVNKPAMLQQKRKWTGNATKQASSTDPSESNGYEAFRCQHIELPDRLHAMQNAMQYKNACMGTNLY